MLAIEGQESKKVAGQLTITQMEANRNKTN